MFLIEARVKSAKWLIGISSAHLHPPARPNYPHLKMPSQELRLPSEDYSTWVKHRPKKRCTEAGGKEIHALRSPLPLPLPLPLSLGSPVWRETLSLWEEENCGERVGPRASPPQVQADTRGARWLPAGFRGPRPLVPPGAHWLQQPPAVPVAPARLGPHLPQLL